MIIPNGTIQFVRMTSDSQMQGTPSVQLDADGCPIAIEETMDAPIPCQFVATSFSFKAKSNGEAVTRQGYNIYIENDGCYCHYPIPRMTERLVMKDMYGREVGRFSVVQIEQLVTVGQTLIKV